MGLMTPQEILSSVELWLLVALPCLNLTVPEFHWGHLTALRALGALGSRGAPSPEHLPSP